MHNYGIIQNGTIVNIAVYLDRTAKNMTGLVMIPEGLSVQIGDYYEDGKFYRDGEVIRSREDILSEQLAEMDAAYLELVMSMAEEEEDA